MLLNRGINQNKQNNKQMQPGQTLFQYLKRKKEVQLKQTLSNALKVNANLQQLQRQNINQNIHKQSTIETKRKHKKSSNKKKKQILNKSNQSQKQNDMRISNKSNFSTKRQKNEGKITSRTFVINTPANIQKQQQFKFQPQYQNIPKKVLNTRSFISMISPLKNRQKSISNSKLIYTKYSINQYNNNQTKIQQNYLKKNIKQTIQTIQNQFEIQEKFEKQIKQKVKLLNSALMSIINQIEQNQDVFEKIVGFQKKTRNVKTNIKLITSFLANKQTNFQDNQNLISELQILMNKSVDSLQGQIKNQSNYRNNNQINIIKEQYQAKIDEIQKQKNRLCRQITISTKKIQKIQDQYNNILEKYNNLEESVQQINKKHKIKINQKTIQLEKQIQNLLEQNKNITQVKKRLQKKLRDSDYKLDQFIRKNKKQSEDKFNQRQGFLIKQIEVIKDQYSKDMNYINSSYQNRQQKLFNKIKNLQKTISEQNLIIKRIQQIIKQNQRQLLLKQSITKQALSKKQSTLMDLYRLNEQLYRHWYALKDIKTLLYRLNLYDKFHTIYKDLSFNETLFFN